MSELCSPQYRGRAKLASFGTPGGVLGFELHRRRAGSKGFRPWRFGWKSQIRCIAMRKTEKRASNRNLGFGSDTDRSNVFWCRNSVACAKSAKVSVHNVQTTGFPTPFSNFKSVHPVRGNKRSKLRLQNELEIGLSEGVFRPPVTFRALAPAQVLRFQSRQRRWNQHKILRRLGPTCQKSCPDDSGPPTESRLKRDEPLLIALLSLTSWLRRALRTRGSDGLSATDMGN